MNPLIFLFNKFPLFNNEELDRCQSEFVSYQFENFDEIYRMDSGWHKISQVTNISGKKIVYCIAKVNASCSNHPTQQCCI